jgi:hypothetical protein
MEEHGRATEAYQKRELAPQLKELADAGLAPKQ